MKLVYTTYTLAGNKVEVFDTLEAPDTYVIRYELRNGWIRQMGAYTRSECADILFLKAWDLKEGDDACSCFLEATE